ncbi:centromere protein J-like isoform X2 [Lineus longissimus]|uniref:centromere protein J-like isoform X2 n=1 Tax=Lineus longissimus TaxID=88925 RepID=UPI00315DA3A9
MSGQPSTKENLLIPGAAAWTSRSGVVLGFDSLSMLTATRKPRGRVSPLSEHNRSDLEKRSPVNSPLKSNYPPLPSNFRRGLYPESPLRNQDYSCSESPSKKLSELHLPKRDFVKAVNFDNLARTALSEEDDIHGDTPEKDCYRQRQQRVGPAGDSNDEGTGNGHLSKLDTSADMTDQQKAKEQTKLLDKFKQMRQLQLQQQDKLIQQQQEQLDALRMEQQRVQQMLAKQRDWKGGRNSHEASPASSPYTSPSQVPLKTTMPTHQVYEESDQSEEEDCGGESYEYGSDKENIPMERVLHDEYQDDASSIISEEEDDGSVTVEGVVPFTDTASACSEMDEEPKQLYSSYEVETMVQVYSKKQKKSFKKAAPVGEFTDEEEEYMRNALLRDNRVETPSPRPYIEDSPSPPHASGAIDDKPVVGAGKSFEQLLAEQLQLEERKEQLGIGYTPSPKGPRKKTFLRRGEGIARFTGPPPKPVQPKKTFRKPVASTSSASIATSVSTSTSAVTANKKEAIKAPLKTLLLKPLQKPSQKKSLPAQPAKVKPGAGNASIDVSFQQRVQHMENNEKDELDELEEFELLEKVADNFSFTSSDSSLAGKAKTLEAANKTSRYEELMKRLAMESSSDYSSESSDSEDDENEDENLEKTLIEEKDTSYISSEVSTPRKMQRKIASRDAGMAVMERDVLPSDFKEPADREHSESEEEEDDDDSQNTLIKHDEIGYRLSQHGDSPKKQTESLDFDDEDSWGDFGPTPHKRAEVKETRPVVKTSPVSRDKGRNYFGFVRRRADHVQVEKVRATEEDGVSASPPPVSNLMTKLFPTLKPPKPKPSIEEQQNQAKLQAARQPEVAEGAVSKALRDKLLEIEREIERFRTENAAVAKIKVEREEGLNKLKREMEEFEKQKEEELRNLQEFKEQELKKLKKEKKLFEKYRKEAQAIPDKKQRDEIEQLNHELCDLREDLKKREQRWTSGTNRMRNRIEQLEKENAELKEEIRMLEKRRLDSWQKEQNAKNEQRSQLPVRKAIVQQVLPSTKNPSKLPKANQESNDRDRQLSNRNDPLRLSVQSEDDDDLSVGDDAQLNSTVIERVKSPFEDTPRGLVAMTTQSEVDKSFMGPAGQKSARKNQALITAITKIDKGDLEYEESRHKDGKIDRIYTNGAREIMYANGTRREISGDGKTIIVSFFNGDMKQIMPDHRVIYFYADAGTTHTTYPDGLEILQFPNLQIEKHYPDGTREITFPDQIIKYLFPNGSEESIFPDGTVIRVDKNGDRTVEFANGQREIHTQQFKKREYPDGTTKTVYPDGRQETRYSTGRVRVKDKHGIILVDQMSV